LVLGPGSLRWREGTLLPSGKFPRIAVAVALILAALLIADLLLVHTAKKSLLVANSLDLVMVLWASGCCFYVAQRSTSYARQIWSLLGIALALETIAQAISAFYQSFVPGAGHAPWPSDVLFFLWVVPIFMMFLPQSVGKLPGVDWLRVLDFAQITIVAATAYLYFFYVRQAGSPTKQACCARYSFFTLRATYFSPLDSFCAQELPFLPG